MPTPLHGHTHVCTSGSSKEVDIGQYVTDKIGLPMLQDIVSELAKPGRDPRGETQAFVNVGIKQDGLVHVSQLADKYVSNPADVVKLHQQVMVKVVSIDTDRSRIGFTMKGVN